ncbi:MAG: IclR family transcriptional regulator C-terminal domain-containing protein [Caldimonas sp.]
MTSPSRVFAVVSLFSEDRPVWHTDDINVALDYKRATGYRYVKELVEAGFLQKVAAGRYALGMRFIELDYLLRRTDVVLLAAAPVMEELTRKTRLDGVLTAMFGMKVIDTYRASVDPTLELGYGRGRPRPLFQGAAPKVILSCLPRPQLVRIYEAHAEEIASRGLGADWTAFRTSLAEIRRAGFYLSHGELEPAVGGAAVPIVNAEGDVLAALALVGKNKDLRAFGAEPLQRLLEGAAKRIQADVTRRQRRSRPSAARGRAA